jgi:hypothetical protein
MKLSDLNRRAHLYLGLALLPWFLLYGVSSIPFAHNAFFEALDKAKNESLWTLRLEKAYDVAVPEDPEQLREFARATLKLVGIEGTNFGAFRQGPDQLNIYSYTFLHSTQLKYFTAEKRLRVEERRFRWDHFLTGMHARGGFEQEGWLPSAWAVVVDLFCLAILFWIGSGIYMWWNIQQHRGWGWIAIAGGLVTFVLFGVLL